eukprot:264822-Amphidinium_carterae.1
MTKNAMIYLVARTLEGQKVWGRGMPWSLNSSLGTVSNLLCCTASIQTIFSGAEAWTETKKWPTDCPGQPARIMRPYSAQADATSTSSVCDKMRM